VTGASKLLIGQAAGLAVAGFGIAAVLLLRGQRRITEQLAVIESHSDEAASNSMAAARKLSGVEEVERDVLDLLKRMVEFASDEVGARRERIRR
jgi:hypothetical protein